MKFDLEIWGMMLLAIGTIEIAKVVGFMSNDSSWFVGIGWVLLGVAALAVDIVRSRRITKSDKS